MYFVQLRIAKVKRLHKPWTSSTCLFDTPIVETTDSVSQVAYIPNNIVHTENPEVTLPVPVLDNAVNNVLPQGAEQLVADPLEAPVSIATYIWLAGIVAMIGVSMISYVKLRKSLVGAVRVRGNIYVADYITTPFVLGIFRPRIYLLSLLSEQEQEYILRHEQYHIRRGDHIFKLLAYVALCIHWFNPLVWLAFLLFSKDMEMSCGEEWLPSAPLHVLLYRAFGWEDTMPEFAHLPLLLKPDGNGKLSKRDGDRLGFPVFPLEWHDPKTGEVSSGYRESGYLPEAVINFLALLGWNPGNDQEIMSLDELVQLFKVLLVQGLCNLLTLAIRHVYAGVLRSVTYC